MQEAFHDHDQDHANRSEYRSETEEWTLSNGDAPSHISAHEILFHPLCPGEPDTAGLFLT